MTTETQPGEWIDLQVQQIVEQLNTNSKDIQQKAEQRLKELGPEAVVPLLKVLSKERVKLKHTRKMALIGMLIFFMVMGSIAIFARVYGMLGCLGSITSVIVAAFAASPAQKSIAKTLAKYADLRSVGALAEALEYQDKEVTLVAGETLIDLLPRMQASDAGLLDGDQRKCLCRALNGKNAELTCAILKAFEQVGDEHALPAVQRLAEGHGRAANNSVIRIAAQECLPALTQRTEMERSRQMLLRAAGPTDALPINAGNLLRPAAYAAETHPDQLLRASLDSGFAAVVETDVSKVSSVTIQNTPANKEVTLGQ